MDKNVVEELANSPDTLRHLVRRLATRLVVVTRRMETLKLLLEITWTLIVVALAIYVYEVVA